MKARVKRVTKQRNGFNSGILITVIYTRLRNNLIKQAEGVKKMGKKVFIVSSTLRKNGNSEILAEAFAKGAREAGNEVVKIDLREKELKFCTGCMYCADGKKCVLDDFVNGIYDEVQNSDVLVFATPVYYYSVSGQLKTFLDRLNPLYARKNRFKKVYLLASSADDDKSAMDGAITAVKGWTDCFDGVSLGGVVYGTGVEKAGEINATKAVSEAYETGKNV